MHGGSGMDWHCSCGAVNASVAAQCYRCGRRPELPVGGLGGAATVVGTLRESAAAHLVGVSLRQAGRAFALDPSRPLTVGRAAASELLLEGEGTVSAQHARIIPMPPYFALEDLASTNGTYVNGRRIMERTMLGMGDVLQFGEVQFRLEAAPPATAAPPPSPYAGYTPGPYAGSTAAPTLSMPPAAGPVHAPYSPYGAPQSMPVARPEYPPYAPVYSPYPVRARKSKLAAGLLALFLGPLGVHCFYLGQIGWGFAHLALALLTCGLVCIVTSITSLVQAILYFCASDEDFHQKYVVEQRFF